MKIRNSIWLFVLTIISACSSHDNLIAQRQRTSAPKNAQDVGVVLDGAQAREVTTILAAHPTAQVRVLNREHGLYEVFGVSTQQIRNEFTGSAEINSYFTLNPKRSDATLFSQPVTAGFQVGSLAPCALSNTGPEAVLSVTSPRADLDGNTIELGQMVQVSGLQSRTTVGSTAPLKMVLAIQYPEASPTPERIQDGSSLQFTPDTLGLYQIALLVQDGNNSCALDGLSFIVTANRPYNGPNAPALTVDLAKFTHLPMVSAEEAWKISRGEGMTIAIVDTGINYNHPSLAPNIKINLNEIPSNAIDDDKNGFIDDVLGYDFVNDDAYPYDDDSHGTHVAGLAAGTPFGLASHAKILPIKALNSLGGDVGTIAAAIRYAVDRGANIINLSLGAEGPAPHPALLSAVAYAEQKGVLLVIAAGNGDAVTGAGFDLNKRPEWPAALKNSNILTVAASDSKDALTPYSNFGAGLVDVVAPGGGTNDLILSAAFENPAGELFIGMAGTSMATPIVSGIAADVMSHSPSLSLLQVKTILLNSGYPVPALTGVTVSGRQVDALSALQSAHSTNVLF